VRSGRGVAPTSTAEALIAPVRDALERLRAGIEPAATFTPQTSTRVFAIAAGDVAATLFAPALLQRTAQMAPNVRVHWRQAPRQEIAAELASRRLDLAIDIPGLRGAEMDDAPLMADHYVCALRADHPARRRKLTLAAFMALTHITVSSRPAGRGIVEEAIRKHGLRLTPVLRLAHYLPALEAAATTDCVLIAPRSLAAADTRLVFKPLPFATPPLSLRLYGSSVAAHDPGLNWLRVELTKIAKAT